MKKIIRYAVRDLSRKSMGTGDGSDSRGEKRKGGAEPEGMDEKSLLNIAIFRESFLMMH